MLRAPHWRANLLGSRCCRRAQVRGGLLCLGRGVKCKSKRAGPNGSLDEGRGEYSTIEDDRQVFVDGVARHSAERAGIRLVELKNDRVCGPLILSLDPPMNLGW